MRYDEVVSELVKATVRGSRQRGSLLAWPQGVPPGLVAGLGGMGGSYSRSSEKKAKEAALLAAPVPLHRHSVTCIKFCNGGDLVLTASEDRTLALWDFSQGQKFGKLWRLNKLMDPCSKPAEDAAAAHGHPASVGVLHPPPSADVKAVDGIQHIREGSTAAAAL